MNLIKGCFFTHTHVVSKLYEYFSSVVNCPFIKVHDFFPVGLTVKSSVKPHEYEYFYILISI